jgi:hypothetical protein
MLVAFNVSLKERELTKSAYGITYPKQSFVKSEDKKDSNIQNIILQQIKERLSDKNKSTKEKERDYEKFVQELGAKELNGLSPDEIKIKLNQIMDWNEKKGKDDKNT